jgi:hypothetical protein
MGAFIGARNPRSTPSFAARSEIATFPGVTARSFREHLRDVVHVVPTVSDRVSAMSAARMRQLLAGYDPLVVVEAASIVLATIEAGERDA